MKTDLEIKSDVLRALTLYGAIRPEGVQQLIERRTDPHEMAVAVCRNASVKGALFRAFSLAEGDRLVQLAEAGELDTFFAGLLGYV